MSMNRNARVPAVPTPPQGEQIAAYATYLEAQRAVDHLSDKEFAVQHVTIVGTDLRMVERVTGRLTYARVALAGLASGAWFGLFVGLVLSFFSTGEGALGAFVLPIGLGAGFGMLFGVISYSLTGGKRDFTSSSQIVASTYALLCHAEHAHQARALLAGEGGPGLGRPAARPAQPAGGPASPFGTPPSQPGYGVPQPPAAAPGPTGPAVPPVRPEPGPDQPGHPPTLPPTQPPAGPGS